MTDAGAGNPAAGWYPDPQTQGQQRYWDGASWTEHTAPLSGQAVATAPAAPSTWLWQSIAATVLCCLPLGIAGIVFASQAGAARDYGNLEVAAEKAGRARLFTLIAVGIWVVGIVVWFAAVALGVGGALTGAPVF